MRENLEIVLTILKVIVGILLIGAILVVVFGGLSLGVQILWKMIPFSVTGFVLGLIIIGITYYFSKEYFPDRKLSLSFNLINELAHFESFGYLYGFLTILASIIWFFLPSGLVQTFPSYVNGFGYSIVAVLMTYGIGNCFGIAILSFRVYLTGSLFYLACGVFGLVIVNYPIWSFTERIPSDYYFLGKAILLLIIFIQIFYIALFHIIPSIQKYKKEIVEGAKNSE